MINKDTKRPKNGSPRTSFESMSRSNQNKINYFENDPRKPIKRLVREYQESSRMVQDIFNNIDPLGTLKGSANAYTECIERFMDQLGNQQITNLTRDQIETMVRNSFHQSQIGAPVPEDVTERLVNYIDSLRNPF